MAQKDPSLTTACFFATTFYRSLYNRVEAAFRTQVDIALEKYHAGVHGLLTTEKLAAGVGLSSCKKMLNKFEETKGSDSVFEDWGDRNAQQQKQRQETAYLPRSARHTEKVREDEETSSIYSSSEVD